MAAKRGNGRPWGAIVLLIVFFVELVVVGGLSYARHQNDGSSGGAGTSSRTSLGAHTFVTG